MGWKKELRKLPAEEDFQAGALDENISIHFRKQDWRKRKD